MNTIEFYGGDISANFATSPNPFIVAGAQDNGSSYGQFGPGATCPDTGCQWSQRIGGDGFYARIEPKQGQRVFMESQNGNLQRSTTGPAGPYLVALTGPWGGDRLSFIFPYEIDKFACPTPTCDHMIAGTVPRLGVDQRRRQLVHEQPRPDQEHARRPLVHQPALVRADDERQRDRRHERRQRPVRLRPRDRDGEHGQLGQRHRRQRHAPEPADPGRRRSARRTRSSATRPSAASTRTRRRPRATCSS